MSDEELQSEIVLELAEEFLQRYRKGERPPLREYIHRHPELAAEIKDVFPAMAMMENIAIADESLEGQSRRSGVKIQEKLALEQLGDYRILREIGHGGMGVVYEAEQVSLGRHVALKVLPYQALADAKTKRRFEREAKAAAKLHHTNIVPVFGVGEHEGRPYYVMQFIQGLGLDTVLDELKSMRHGAAPTAADHTWDRDIRVSDPNDSAGKITDSLTLSSSSITLSGAGTGPTKVARKQTYWQRVARIGVQIADALEYAHQQGIHHRDIKPSNLLLDAAGTVWITDFGLAKAAGSTDNLTQSGDVLGTPRYMPPEAFEGRTDARGDIYSLGLTLYELLCLRPAFDEKDRHRLLKQVTTSEPPRLDRLNRAVPRDLVTVIHKAIDRDPAHRYASAAALAADLERFVNDEPIQARRASASERCRRWCRHNPAVASLLATVALLLVGGAAVSIIAAVRIAGARDEATENARQAVAAKENEAAQRQLAEGNAHESRSRLVRLHATNGERLLDEGDLLGALPWLTEALRLERGDPGRQEKHRIRLAGVLAQAPRLLQLWNHDHEAIYAAFSSDGRRVVTTSLDRTARLWDAETGQAIAPPLRHAQLVWKAAFSPDARLVVTASQDGTAQVWDARTGLPAAPVLTHQGPVIDVSFSRDGRWVATASTDGTARLWDAITGQPRTPPLKHASWLNAVSFSPDGRHIVTASHDDTAQVWDAATGKPIAPPVRHAAAVRSAAFSPDGRKLVTASDDRTARVWDAVTSQSIDPPLEHGDIVLRAEFSPDGRYISTCSYDTTARVWDATTGRAVTPSLKHRNSVRYASFSPDGRYVVTASYDHTARVWEAATGEAVTPPLRHNSLVSSALFSPDGRQVISASADWTVRMWGIDGRGEAPVTLRHGREVWCATFSPDGHLLVTASADGTAQVWSAISGQRLAGPLRHEAAVLHACFSADSRRVVTASQDRTARVWDAATGEALIPPLKHRGRVFQATFSPDGNRVVTASTDNSAQIWDAHTGAPLGPRLEHRQQVYTATFSRDGRRVVTASSDGTARIWDATTGVAVAPPLEHQGPVEEASFSPDGRRVVTASADYTARVWDTETGRPITEPLQHGAGVAAASFSPDGSRVLTGSRQGTARLWDAATGAPLTPLLKHGMGQIRVAFSPDGLRVVTGGGDYAARVWDAATGEFLGPPLRHRGWVYHLAFSPNGHRLATACHDGSARVWLMPGPDPRPQEDLVLLAEVLSAQRVDAKEGLVEVEPTVQRRALETLRFRYPAHFGDSAGDALAWHQREAEACLREKNGPATLFHLLHSCREWSLFTHQCLP